uniref:Uncharacterized protein n=1 Tax=Knipowitschia caucasica TaxID=637954 RepID=A0AAV2MEP0_KNICA
MLVHRARSRRVAGSRRGEGHIDRDCGERTLKQWLNLWGYEKGWISNLQQIRAPPPHPHPPTPPRLNSPIPPTGEKGVRLLCRSGLGLNASPRGAAWTNCVDLRRGHNRRDAQGTQQPRTRSEKGGIKAQKRRAEDQRKTQ